MSTILERSRTDGSFRAQLLDDPRTVIYSEFGVRIPEPFRLRFIERDREVDALVVLPDFLGEGELDEDDLEKVCGGTGPDNPPW